MFFLTLSIIVVLSASSMCAFISLGASSCLVCSLPQNLIFCTLLSNSLTIFSPFLYLNFYITILCTALYDTTSLYFFQYLN